MIGAEAATGTHPLSQYVLKVHSRCDLACDHCYVYEHADQGWRRQPIRMDRSTVAAAAKRIAAHATAHALPQVTVVLHGGEPLLLGVDGLRAVLTELRSTIAPVTDLRLRMQSNGVRLNEAFCDVFVEYGVKVGISFDGDRAANDRHRRYTNGASSYDEVRRALRLLRQPVYRPIYSGILCTVDIANDPIAVYTALAGEDPPAIDLLLPHATWDRPPTRPPGRPTAYADWLLRIHRRWTADGRRMRIRMFDAIHGSGAGGSSTVETLGLEPKDLVVVETDGSWEQVDSLKTAFDGATGTGLDVFRHSVDDAAGHGAIAQRQVGLDALCATCQACPVVRQCGGGLLAHRYRSGTGFQNPSVYCADLKHLIQKMNEQRTVPAQPVAEIAGGEPSELSLFDDLGRGAGSDESVAALVDIELAITRALLWQVAAEAERTDPAGLAAHGWRQLLILERQHPRSAAVDRVLRHPFLRAWATACLDGRADSAYLAAIAAAVAIRLGADFELDVPAAAAGVFLPTLGLIKAPGAAPVRLRSDGGRRTVTAHGHRPVAIPDGDPSATHVALPGLDLLIEDADAYRDRFDLPVTGALSANEQRNWSAALVEAWHLVGRDAPQYRPGLAAGLRAVVPLAPGRSGTLRSASSQYAFGAVATQLCSPADLAVQLVHEYQHSKMAALFDGYTLFDDSYRQLLPVGWRSDPRPIEGVLQGTYAHLAVADLWRARARADQAAGPTFRRYRDWTARATDTLLATRALTTAGERLVRGMAAAVDSA
jgi:uncharacterized protein